MEIPGRAHSISPERTTVVLAVAGDKVVILKPVGDTLKACFNN